MSKWYLYEDEEVVGPFTPDQLQERIDPQTLVCRAGSEDWQKAGNVDELHSILLRNKNQSTRQHQADSRAQTRENEKKTATREKSQEVQSRDREESKQAEPDDIIKPTLENLRDICERAENEDLLEQYEDHWTDYDASERRIILAEIQERGLFEET